MKSTKINLIIAVFAIIPSLVSASDYTGEVPEGCYRTPWQSKVSVDTNLSCKSGNAVKSISFKHRHAENLTYQESYQLLCCKAPSLTNNCFWDGDFTSNENLSTEVVTAPDGPVTGIRFKHRFGENFTYQQEFRLLRCYEGQRSNTFGSWIKGNKVSLETEFSCSSGNIYGVGFSHKNGENLTYQETVKVFCPQ